ncbi:hypothetical protein LEN26_006291 [Aphanomyces euteiches]|nr:hypothetical protein AeMF1_009412 [Aphanomyces euteiches]KAH9136044.1 hypothetical protein LEN26_006291 [Aphanomyces euteiches]KAH9197722.1 hypothetical protein AeNC1_000306 [Aphanomyces euteiches]
MAAKGALALGSPFTYHNESVELWLSPNGIAIKGSKTEEIAWLDVLGAATAKNILSVFSCVQDQHGHRHLRELKLASTANADCEKFVHAIRYMAKMYPDHKEALLSIDEMAEKTPPQQRCLVVINPIGGPGRAVKIYESQVDAIFKAANIAVTSVITEAEYHAIKIAASLDLKAYDFMVCVGGDGLACEIVQGLMQRKDWQEAIKFPLGIIPGGSGNGLAKTLVFDVGVEYTVENCAFAIAKGKPQPIDITTTRNEHQTSYGFLALSWAFIADVDLKSEHFRFMGSARFTMAAVVKLLSLKRWSGRVKYLVDTSPGEMYWDANHTSSDKPKTPLLANADNDPSEKWETIEGRFNLFWASSVSHPSHDVHLVPGAQINDGFIYLAIMDGKASVLEMASFLLAMEKGSHINSPSFRLIKTKYM